MPPEVNEEEVKPGEEGTPAPAPTEGGEPASKDISNADLKANSTFQKVTGELAALRAKEAERETAASDKKVADERKRLEDSGKYKEALKLRDDQLKEQTEKHAADLLQRDLKNELLTVGFSNSIFVNGAIGDFSGDATGVAEYVKGLAAKEENKVFLGAAKRQTIDPAAPAGGTVKAMSLEEARFNSKESNQKDPAVRSAARKVIAADYNKQFMQ